MLRTNTKKARENVRKYIIDYTEDIFTEYGKETPTTDESKLAELYDIFLDEYGRKDYRTRSRFGCVCFDVFEDYARGLALNGLFCYYYNRSAVDDLGAILEESEEEKARFTEEQAEEKLTYLIFRELQKAYERRV